MAYYKYDVRGFDIPGQVKLFKTLKEARDYSKSHPKSRIYIAGSYQRIKK